MIENMLNYGRVPEGRNDFHVALVLGVVQWIHLIDTLRQGAPRGEIRVTAAESLFADE